MKKRNKRVQLSLRLKFRSEYIHPEDERTAWNAKICVSGLLYRQGGSVICVPT